MASSAPPAAGIRDFSGLSIVVPAFNEENYIGKTLSHIRSVFPNAEIIVADCHSADATAEIARSLGCKVIFSEKRSAAAARNAGWKAASSEIVLFNDADTLPSREFAQKIFSVFSDSSVAGFGCRSVPEKGFFARIFFFALNLFVFLSSKLGRPVVSGNSVAYRKSVLKKLGGFDEEMQAGEDQDLCIRASREGKIVFDFDSTIFISMRRAEKGGWPRLLLDWTRTSLNFALGKKTKSYEGYR